MSRLSGIKQADPVSYTAAMGSESVTVVFDASLMTGRWEREITRALKEDDGERMASLLFSVFISWDVVDDEGRPVAISEEILLDLPGKALQSLLEGMQEVSGPSSEEGNASSNILSVPPTDSSSRPESPQNGPTPSTLPTPSASPSMK